MCLVALLRVRITTISQGLQPPVAGPPRRHRRQAPGPRLAQPDRVPVVAGCGLGIVAGTPRPKHAHGWFAVGSVRALAMVDVHHIDVEVVEMV